MTKYLISRFEVFFKNNRCDQLIEWLECRSPARGQVGNTKYFHFVAKNLQIFEGMLKGLVLLCCNVNQNEIK